MAGKVVKTKFTIGPDVDLSRTVLRDKNGKRLSAARAERIGRSAVDRVVGRPSLSANSVESPQLKVRVPVKLKKALDKEARRRGETTSSIVREALEKYLKSA
jgi:Ribbon-helix-helix protein, copG family